MMAKKKKEKGFLKKRIQSKKILKKERATLVIKKHEDIPYQSTHFNEDDIQMKNNFLFGK